MICPKLNEEFGFGDLDFRPQTYLGKCSLSEPMYYDVNRNTPPYTENVLTCKDIVKNTERHMRLRIVEASFPSTASQ
jgi:hypothetical protein